MLIICKSDVRPPTAPVISVAAASSSTITVTLVTPATDLGPSGVADYSLQRATDVGFTANLVSTSVATTAFPLSVTGLSASTQYYFRMQATDVSGNVGIYSAIVNATTQAASSGFDYYIGLASTHGASNSNPGTAGSPWLITALNDATKRTLYAGKTVGILDGTYGLYDIMGVPPAGAVGSNRLTVAAGSASARTVIKAVNMMGAIIDGQTAFIFANVSTVDWYAGLMGPGGNYVTFDGIKFTGGNWSNVVNHGGGSNFTVINCWLTNQSFITFTASGTNSSNLYFERVSNTRVANCFIDLGSAPSDGGRHAMIQTYADDDTIIEYCTIVSTSSNGIHHKGNPGTGTRPGKRHTIRNCYIDASGAGGASVVRWHGNESTDGSETMHHCVLVAGSSIVITSEGTNNTFDFYNNTTSAGSPNALFYLPDGSPLAINYNNSIMSRTGTGSYGDIRYGSNSLLSNVDYNLWDSSPALSLQTGATTYTTLGAFQAATGKDAHSAVTTNPLFTGTGAYAAAYQLQAGSAGKTLGVGGTEVGAWAGQTQVGWNSAVRMT